MGHCRVIPNIYRIISQYSVIVNHIKHNSYDTYTSAGVFTGLVAPGNMAAGLNDIEASLACTPPPCFTAVDPADTMAGAAGVMASPDKDVTWGTEDATTKLETAGAWVKLILITLNYKG